MDPSADATSTSREQPSRRSPRSPRASAGSGWPGEGGDRESDPTPSEADGSEPALGYRALRALAARHGIRPTKRRGQHFLADPNLARSIAATAGIEPGTPVVEVGPGFGSLTVALARAGADVLAIEIDRALAAALEEVARHMSVRVVVADALRFDWASALRGREHWLMVSNLPYNVATPLLLGMLERDLPIERYLVMVQREVGERLVAGPGDEGYGGSSVRVAYHAGSRLLRRIAPSVFWPQPAVESVLVELVPLTTPPVDAERDRLFRVVEEAFAQRRKTMRNALVRLGLDPADAAALLAGSGIPSGARAEQLSLHDFARIAGAIP